MKNIETERKFLVRKETWDALSKPEGIRYVQGYLSTDEKKVVRVRVAGEKGFLTIKGRSDNISRPEYEYKIPADDATEMINLFCKNRVEKTRTRIPAGNHVWEVDEFLVDNEGLLLAEIELESADDAFEKPEWVLEEVTGDPRYYNSYLAENPYKSW
jgi:adenylate cyclase